MMRVWTLGVVAAAALGIAGCEDRRGVDRGDAREEVREQGRDLGSSADKAGENLREGANDTKRELRETGREAQGKNGLDDKIKDKAEDAKD
jgi:hypothetical protein